MTLIAMGVVYSVFCVAGFTMLSSMPPESRHAEAFIYSLVGLAVISTVSELAFRGLRIVGLLDLSSWSSQASQPIVVGLGSFAIVFGITPQLLTSILLQVPTGGGEESVFRVLGINMLLPAMGDNASVVSTSIIFGFMHWLAYGLSFPGVATAMMSGFILGYMYLTTGSAIGVALAHTSWNILVLVVATVQGATTFTFLIPIILAFSLALGTKSCQLHH
jgi:membrane protease YdiL (CAAX protease family)